MWTDAIRLIVNDILPALKYGVSCSLKIPYVFVAEGIWTLHTMFTLPFLSPDLKVRFVEQANRQRKDHFEWDPTSQNKEKPWSKDVYSSSEPFVAHLTPKWFLSGVNAVMSCQTAGCCKPFATDFAPKWFLSCVSAVVSGQMAGIGKLFVTHLTHKRWLASGVEQTVQDRTG